MKCWCGSKLVGIKRKACETTSPKPHEKPKEMSEHLYDIPPRWSR